MQQRSGISCEAPSRFGLLYLQVMDFERNFPNPDVRLFLDLLLSLAQTHDLDVNAINCVELRWCDDLLLALNPGAYWFVFRLATNLSSLASLLDQLFIELSNLVRRIH